MGNGQVEGSPRRVSRQREAGAATRLETQRQVLAAARLEFSEKGYLAATVARIAGRADVAVQTLYSAWGSKRALLRAAMETLITGTDEGFEPGRQPLALIRGLPVEQTGDAPAVLGYLSHQFRLVSQRSAVAWQIYRDAAAVDPEIAADWQQLQDIRRRDMQDMLATLPSHLFPWGLSAAADTLWVIASPQTHELLVRYADYTYDQYETWVRETLLAALTRGRPDR